jgi:hypothetical protein
MARSGWIGSAIRSGRRLPSLALLGIVAVACAGQPAARASSLSASIERPSPSAAVGPARSTSMSVTATPRDALDSLDDGRQLEPGRYVVDYLPEANITMQVPSGWVSFQGWAVLKGGSADPPAGMGLGFKLADNVYGDSCRWRDTLLDPPVGPTVDDFVTALGRQPAKRPTKPVDVTIDGFRGKRIEISVPSDLAFASCDEGMYRSYTTSNWDGTDTGLRFSQGPSQVDRTWIIDVVGHRLAIIETFYPANSAVEKAELEAMVASVRIDPKR